MKSGNSRNTGGYSWTSMCCVVLLCKEALQSGLPLGAYDEHEEGFTALDTG